MLPRWDNQAKVRHFLRNYAHSVNDIRCRVRHCCRTLGSVVWNSSKRAMIIKNEPLVMNRLLHEDRQELSPSDTTFNVQRFSHPIAARSS